MLTFVDLFCGIGTIRMGMEQAGHKCVYSVEWDKHKRKIYSIIFGGEPEGADIRTVRHSDIPRADVWTFGAPCQDFSIAGKRAGMEGERSSLVLEVFRLVRETPEEDRPKYLIYENVKGMLSSNGGRDFLGILIEMAALGYDRIEYSLLNSKNFGVPQNRERVFVVGHLRGRSTGKVFPITGNNGEALNQLVGGSQGMRVYDPSGVSCTLAAEAGGLGAKTGLYFIDLSTQEARVTDHARCLQARYNKGYSHRKGEVSGVLDVHACLTPDRIEKRQNGRRFKEPGEPMFTLTTQDVHGVAIQEVEDGESEGNTYKALFELRKEIGEEAFAEWGLGILDSLQCPEVLRQGVYEVSLGENKSWGESEQQQRAYNGKADKQIPHEENRMRDLWQDKERGYSPQGRELSQQLRGKFDCIVQELPHETAQAEVCLHDLRRASEGIGLLQQALYKVQEIRGPKLHKVPQYRIRKLTPRECMRLQGVPDEITDKVIQAGISDSQMYRGAGDACTVNVIYEIAKKLT